MSSTQVVETSITTNVNRPPSDYSQLDDHTTLSSELLSFACRCSSKVGKSYAVAGAQKLSLGQGCDFEGTIIHELLHTLGE